MTKKKPKAINAEVNWRLVGEMESRLRRVEEVVEAIFRQQAEADRRNQLAKLSGRVDCMIYDFTVQINQLQRDILELRGQPASRTLWQRISSLWS